MLIQREYLNLLKWFALIAMVVFHFSTGLLYDIPESVVFLGRLAFPIFGFVLGYNLAISDLKGDTQAEAKMMRLLLVFGCFAQPFYWAHIYSALPLNIMFTLALGVFMVYRHRQYTAWLVFIVIGFIVDYPWAGALYVLASFLIARRSLSGKVPLHYIVGFVMSLAAVSWSTLSPFPMYALALFWIGLLWNPSFQLPRCKWLFYAIYPAHLALLQLIKQFY